MCDRIGSLGARAMTTVANIRRAPAEDIGQWWRRLHRAGHQLIAKYTVAPNIMRRLRVHRWAGHPARMKPEQWWWESQIANVYGDGYAENNLDNTGWLAQAQQRNDWKSMELYLAQT